MAPIANRLPRHRSKGSPGRDGPDSIGTGLSRRDALPSGFRDGANLVFVDEKVRVSHARKPQHCVVEVFDPAADGFAVAQFDGDGHLAIAEGAEIEGFLASFAGRRRLGAASRG